MTESKEIYFINSFLVKLYLLILIRFGIFLDIQFFLFIIIRDFFFSESSVSNTLFGSTEHNELSPEVIEVDVKRSKRKRQKREPSSDSNPPEEVEMPMFPIELENSGDADSDKLFFMSFLPELRQLPVHIKMWVRAQVANVMQEAVACHYNNTRPGSSDQNGINVKRPPHD